MFLDKKTVNELREFIPKRLAELEATKELALDNRELRFIKIQIQQNKELLTIVNRDQVFMLGGQDGRV